MSKGEASAAGVTVAVGDYLLFEPGVGDEELFVDLAEARAAAAEAKGDDGEYPVYIVQIVEIV